MPSPSQPVEEEQYPFLVRWEKQFSDYPLGLESCEFRVTCYKAGRFIWVGVSQRGPHLNVPPLPQIQAVLQLGLQDTQFPGSASVEKTVEDSGLWLCRALRSKGPL